MVLVRLQPHGKLYGSRRVKPADIAAVGWLPVPSGRLALGKLLHRVVTISFLAAFVSGVALDTALVSMTACSAMLLFGLPHGTLDLALIRKSRRQSNNFAVIALYLGCAAAMYALWQIDPAIALATFFALSIAHFAEDWAEALPPFFAHATAIALLAAPALFHRHVLDGLFALLVGGEAPSIFADVAVLVAPVALAVAAVGVISMWTDGYYRKAIATTLSLVGLIVLPPVVGFALFFCLMHSPGQFAMGLQALGWTRVRQWMGMVAPLTIAALGIAVAIFSSEAPGDVPQAMIVTAFVTLSVLTLPHMIVPVIVRQLAGRYGLKYV